MADAIVESVSQKMIEKVASSEDNIPEEFANEERDKSVAEKIETTHEVPFEESQLLAKREAWEFLLFVDIEKEKEMEINFRLIAFCS